MLVITSIAWNEWCIPVYSVFTATGKIHGRRLSRIYYLACIESHRPDPESVIEVGVFNHIYRRGVVWSLQDM